MSTPIYGFPIPTLATVADGPDGFSDLALRVEREMTVLRSTTVNTKEQTIGINPGGSYAVHIADFPMSTIGWINVEASLSLGVQDANPAAYPPIAGQFTLSIGGSIVRNLRWHSQGRTRLIEKTIAGHKLVTAATTTMSVQIAVSADIGSAAISYFMSEIAVRQFGAPST